MKINELPHDLIAEKSLIGCLMFDGKSIDEINNLKLNKDDFYDSRYGIVFTAIEYLSIENKAIDFVTVHSRLDEVRKLDQIGGDQFLTDLIEDHANSANVYHYAKIVKDKSVMRAVIKHSIDTTNKGLSYQGTADDFIQETESDFFKLTNQAKSTKLVSLGKSLDDNLKDLEDADRKPGQINGLPSGFSDLDRKILGMQAGQLIVIAARPGMGKSSLALDIASFVAKEYPVTFFSLEMINKELSLRLLTSKARVRSERVRMKDFRDTDIKSISHAVSELKKSKMFMNDSSGLTIADIQSQCRKIKADHGLGLIVVDYLQLMAPLNKSAPREQQISEMSRGLKSIAKELECPIIAISQLNRAAESRDNKRPTTADLRESGAIEQDADIVLLVYRDDFYNEDTNEPGIAEIKIGKNRSGQTGIVKLKWLGEYTHFENIDYIHEEQESPF